MRPASCAGRLSLIPERSSGGPAGCSTRSARASRPRRRRSVRAEAWEQVDRGERPEGDDLAEAFFHLARVEERDGARDEHGRFPAPRRPASTRSTLRSSGCGSGSGSSRRAGAARRSPSRSRMTSTCPGGGRAKGLRAPPRGAKCDSVARPSRARARESCAGSPAPRCTRCAAPIRTGASTASSRTSGAAARRRPSSCSPTTRTNSTAPPPSRTTGCGRASSRRFVRAAPRSVCTAATRPPRIRSGSRPRRSGSSSWPGRPGPALPLPARRSASRTSGPLDAAGFAYDSSLGFGDAIGFRAGIAHPFRPWDFERGTCRASWSRFRSPRWT